MKTGVALSGGGVRAAGFSSGVMRYLLQYGVEIDYLSTVSGGGYIGASYMDWKYKNEQKDNHEWHHEFFEHVRRNCDFLISWRNPCRGIFDVSVFACLVLATFLMAALAVISFAIPFSYIVDICLGEVLRGGFICPNNSTNVVEETDVQGCVMKRANSKTYMLFAILLLLLMFFYILYKLSSSISVRSKFRVLYLTSGGLLMMTFFPWFIEGFLTSNTSLYVNAVVLFGSIFLWLGIPPLRTKAAVAAIVYLYAYIIKWKVYKSTLLYISYSEKAFNWGLIISALIIWLSPFFGMLKNSAYHTFYRWRLQKAFFYPLSTGGTGCAGITLHDCFPICTETNKEWKNLEEKALTMADLAEMKPEFICNTVVHQWKKCSSSPRTFSLLLLSPYKIERIDEGDGENLFAGLLSPSDVKLSDAMATSAAAMAENMGFVESGSSDMVRDLQLITGFSLSKTYYSSPHGDVAGSTWSVFKILPFLVQLILVAPLILIPVFEEHINYLVLWFVLVLAVFGLLASMPVGSYNFIDRFIRWWVVNVYHIRTLRRLLQVVDTGNTPPPILNISDGGHADNTGLLPLFKKRLGKIVLAEASVELGGGYTGSDILLSLALAREYLHCTFTGTDGEDILADIERKYINPSVGGKPRFYKFKVQYHDFVVDRGEYVQVGEGEVMVVKGRHPVEGCVGNEEAISSWKSYSETTGKELNEHKWGEGPKMEAHDVDRLTGCCCEICHSACCKSCCSPFSGKFPEHSTINLTYTPSMFTAYHREGYRANVDANVKEFLSNGVSQKQDKSPLSVQPQ